MVWRTMEEWNDRGRFISRGEKCLLRDPDGNCLWNKDQTSKTKRKDSYRETRREWFCPNEANYNEYKDWDDLDDAVFREYS